MAEIGKGVTAGKLAINVQKKFSRAQEKVMQKLGKADETRDTAFEELVANFNKQMMEGTKLQKDLKAYLVAVKTMHEASRRLQDCLADMYEPDWFGKEEMDSMAEEMIEKEMDYNLEETDVLWTDYHDKLTDNPVISMDTYLTQFPEIKARIAKRERKMTDFDSARHHFASVQKGKKKDEAKIAKPTALLEMAAPSWAQGLISAHTVAQNNLSRNQAEEELGRAQKVFEELNVELQDELPTLYDSRVGMYVNTFQSMAGYQEKFHKEMGKLSQNLNDIMTKLEEQRQAKKAGKEAGNTEASAKSEGDNHSESADSPPKRPGPPPNRPPPRPTSTPNRDEDDLSGDEASPGDAYARPAAAATAAPQPEQPSSAGQGAHQQQYDDEYQYPAQEAQGGWDDEEGGASSAAPTQGHAPQAGGSGWDDDGDEETPPGEPREAWNDGDGTPRPPESYAQPSWDDEEVVTNGSDGELPPGFLYKAKAVHDYEATDADELELKAADIVLVLAFDTPDEQDDGWLMGVKESHWLEHRDLSIKGVFPENFTQRV